MLAKQKFLIPLIFFSFVLNGVLQERNLQRTYDGKPFRFATGFMLFQTVFMMLVCVGVKLARGERFLAAQLAQTDLLLSGVFQALSIYSTVVMSIKVDYLFNVLLRSSKFLTVLIGTVLFRTHAHHVSTRDIFWGVVLTAGVVVFSFGQESKRGGGETVGYFFGVLSLVCDAFVSHF